MARVTVVLADLADGAADVLATTEAWASRGLLSDSYWIDRDEGFGSARAVGADGVTEVVDVVTSLVARTDLDKLTVVALHVVRSREDALTAPSGHSDHELVRKLYTRTAGTGIDVLTLTLVVLATDAPFPAQTHDGAWHATLVVAAEDRFADDQMPADVGADDLGPHAAGAIATATGMWAATVQAPLDRVDSSLRQHGRGSVRVVRTTARFVDGGPLPDSIVDRVLTVDGSWATPDGCRPGAPDAIIPPAVGALAEHHRLAFAPLASPPSGRAQRIGVLDGIRLFFSTMGRILRTLPSEAIETTRAAAARAIADAVQKATFGLDSDVLVQVAGQVASGRATTGTAEDQHRIVRSLGLAGTEDPQPEADLWHDVRSVACAIIDGTEYPAPLPSPREKSSRLVLPDPASVTPSPFGAAATFPAPELGRDSVVRPNDPRAADELRARLLDLAAEEADLTAGESPTAGRIEALNRWVEERSGTFTWKVGELLAEAAAAAGLELAQALAILKGGPPSLEDSADDVRRRRRLRQLTVTCLVLTVVGVVGAVLAGATGRLGWTSAAAAAIGAVLLFQGIAVVGFIRIARELAQAEFRRHRDHVRWLHAWDRARHAGLATTRFCSLYWQHLDWSEVIGGVAHRPWGHRRGDPVVDRLDDVRTTRSTLLATADPDREQMLRAVALGQRAVITTGWLTAHLMHLEELSNARYARTSATAIDQVQPMHDTAVSGMVLRRNLDSGDDVLTPRGNLHRDVVTEQFADVLRQERSSWALDAAFSLTPDELLGTVKVHGVGAALSGEPVSEFLGDVRATSRRVPFPFSMFADESIGVTPDPESSVVMVPRGVRPDEGWNPTVTRTEPGRNLLYVACRLDMSEGMEASALVSEVPPAMLEADTDGGLGDAPRPLI